MCAVAERQKVFAIERQDCEIGIAGSPDSGGSRPVLEDSDLAEIFAGSQHSEHNVVSARMVIHDLRFTSNNDVEAIGFIALLNDNLARSETLPFKMSRDFCKCRRIEARDRIRKLAHHHASLRHLSDFEADEIMFGYHLHERLPRHHQHRHAAYGSAYCCSP